MLINQSASRNSVYPGPWGQLAQNALFALVSLPRLPGEGGWMQTLLGAVPGLLGAGNDLGKCSLAPKFVQRNFLTIFSRGCPSSAWARLLFQQGCSRIYLQGEMLQVLPSSSHPLGSGPRLFFQILSKCADEGGSFCITSLCQQDTAPCMKLIAGSHSGKDLDQTATDYFIIADHPKYGVSSTQDPPAPSGAQHFPNL